MRRHAPESVKLNVPFRAVADFSPMETLGRLQWRTGRFPSASALLMRAPDDVGLSREQRDIALRDSAVPSLCLSLGGMVMEFTGSCGASAAGSSLGNEAERHCWIDGHEMLF